MGAHSSADHPFQANSLQRPWPPRPFVHDVLCPLLAKRITRVARFVRKISLLKGTFPVIGARDQLLEHAY